MEHYFDDSSLLRQVVSHRLTGLSGPRALLVMAAHPVAFAGFFAHTGALYGAYVRTLTRDELNALWSDYRVVGRRFGLRERDMPRDIDAFEAYMADMYASGELFVTPAARALAIDVVLHPPVPVVAKPLVEL